MTDKFAELKAEIENKNTLAEETVGSQWEAGDECGEKGCTNAVHHRSHERPETDVPAHPDVNDHEFVCTTHGIVGTR